MDPGDYAEGDYFMGVRMGEVFTLGKEFAAMELPEIETLLEQDIHEARACAVKIMALQASGKKTPEVRCRGLYELYRRRHDRINNWDLVDLGAGRIVDGWLMDKPRDVLYQLARSADMWERRTAIVATSRFLRSGDLADTFAIAELLLGDKEDLIHKALGGWVRDAGRGPPSAPRLSGRARGHHAADSAPILDRAPGQVAARALSGPEKPLIPPF
ncbi:DNA alkylation repair protein [Micrococcaceae bacterium Sec5.7]